MTAQSAVARLSDILEAIEKILTLTTDVSLEQFEGDWQKRWLVERGIEIISEASRRLPEELKQRHPGIPWQRVASIGNVLRHEYERVAPAILWKVALDELQPLEAVCRVELRRLKN
ncbi:MAG TPA: HepT-like ribonuclease domain-containing protein [Rhizomicrobium sp.]|nr:HepT-like ribonuclease domain-containing protein [Rhizomicrobium sp.]